MNLCNVRLLAHQLTKLGIYRNFSKLPEVQLVDYVDLSVKGGAGGNGCTATKCGNGIFVADGGNGGQGGDVFISASDSYKDLSHLRNKTVIQGGAGSHGTSKRQDGEMGKSKTLLVPVGTMIGNKEDKKIIVELTKDKEEYHAAIGGQGGHGNYYAGVSVQANSTTGFQYDLNASSPPETGTGQDIYLELRTIADIGLVGFPNCGKSSLLTAISRAKPKVASYPFTTLRPHVGTVFFKGLRRLIVADIPGIIKGASQGEGLGHSFLKHIERCHSLLLVVDVNSADPVDEIRTLIRELELYKTGMNDNIIAVVVNKVDLINDITKIKLIAQNFPMYKILPISALNQKNIYLVRNILEEFSYTTLDDFA